MGMRLTTTLPQNDLNAVPEAIAQAESDGYDTVLTMENRHDPFLALAVAATASRRIGLGTAVAIAFPRSPMVVANVCWDLQRASGGRFVLGLGPQIRPHNERRFSTAWGPPVPRMREYVQALRAIWRCWETGERLRFEGKHYTFTLMTPNFVPEATGQPPVPVTIAAVGPHSLRLAGEVADGVRLHPFCTRRYLEDVCLPLLDQGMTRTGRQRERFEISGGGFIATGATDEEVASRAEQVRYRVAFYGSTPGYWPVLDLHGLGDLGRKLNGMSKAGAWREMAAEISDDTLRLFTVVGRHDELVGALGDRFAGLVDTVNASMSAEIRPALPPDLIQDIRRLPAAFAGH